MLTIPLHARSESRARNAMNIQDLYDAIHSLNSPDAFKPRLSIEQ